jgi:hypothetical protein
MGILDKRRAKQLPEGLTWHDDGETPQASYPEPETVQSTASQDYCLGCGGPVAHPWNDCCARCAARLRRHTVRWMKLN